MSDDPLRAQTEALVAAPVSEIEKAELCTALKGTPLHDIARRLCRAHDLTHTTIAEAVARELTACCRVLCVHCAREIRYDPVSENHVYGMNFDVPFVRCNALKLRHRGERGTP